MSMSAREFIRLVNLYDETPKAVITDNINRAFGYFGERSAYRPYNRRTKLLCTLTDSQPYTVLGWMNKSRDVKIPLLKLCYVADVLGVDILDMFNSTGDWYEPQKEKIMERVLKMERELIEHEKIRGRDYKRK